MMKISAWGLIYGKQFKRLMLRKDVFSLLLKKSMQSLIFFRLNREVMFCSLPDLKVLV